MKYGILFGHRLPPKQERVCEKLIKRVDNWKIRAGQLLDVLKKHPCAGDFGVFKRENQDQTEKNDENKKQNTENKEKVEPKKEYLDLADISLKFGSDEYKEVGEFLIEIRKMWEYHMNKYNSKSVLYAQAKIMNEFLDHLLKTEKIFDKKFICSTEEAENEENEKLLKKQQEYAKLIENGDEGEKQENYENPVEKQSENSPENRIREEQKEDVEMTKLDDNFAKLEEIMAMAKGGEENEKMEDIKENPNMVLENKQEEIKKVEEKNQNDKNEPQIENNKPN